jgi:plasmid stability protein
VPDDIHRRLAASAQRAGRSVNALAAEILDAAIDPESGDRRERLRLRAGSMGLLRSGPAPPVSASQRRRIIASTRGQGPILDRLLAEERERL